MNSNNIVHLLYLYCLLLVPILSLLVLLLLSIPLFNIELKNIIISIYSLFIILLTLFGISSSILLENKKK